MWGPSVWGPHVSDTTAGVGMAEDLICKLKAPFRDLGSMTHSFHGSGRT
jgi:hypothetical protein